MSQPVGSHRAAPVRPRYGRLAALGVAMTVTAVAVVGSFGVLPFTAGDGAVAQQQRPSALGAADLARVAERSSAEEPPPSSPDSAEAEVDPARDTTVPADSGEGRRVVFSQSRQRVWLIGGNEKVRRTYLVSGSVYDNLEPGSYQVYSRSEQAWGIDESGTMRYFVRFAQGERAAIGFHDIPVADGKPVQTRAQLGTPLSHGCIRQKEADAVALWEFAPLGTDVVVTA